MEWILLLGLIALFFVQSNQARRLARLEEDLEWRPRAPSPHGQEQDEQPVRESGAAEQSEFAPPPIPPWEMERWLGASAPGPREELSEEAPETPEEAREPE